MATLDIIINATNNASGALREVRGQLDDLNDSSNKLLKDGLSPVRDMLNTGFKVASAAGVAAFSALTAAIGMSIKSAADMEAQMSAIASVMGKTSDEIAPLKDLIQDLGMDPKLKVSATEAADAIQMLARNGLDMTEIMDGAAKSTVLLANATGADFGTAADIATDAMSIFSISAANMSDAVNGITGVTTSSKFSIDDYRYALAQAGGVAGSVGVEFDDFNTVVAGIAPLFASGSDAGTSFKTFLQQLVPDTNPARDAMRSLGLYTGLSKDEFEKAQAKLVDYKADLAALDPTSKRYAERSAELTDKINVLQESLVQGSNAFFDANGNMKSMDQIAGILSNALSGLSEEQKNAALQTIFGTDAMRAAVGIANLGQQGFSELKATIGNVDAEQSAATRMDNLAGSIEILQGIIEALQLRIGEKFTPVFRRMVDAVATFLSENADGIVAFFGDIAGRVDGAVESFVPMVQRWLPEVRERFGTVGDILQMVRDRFDDGRKRLDEFIETVKNAIKPLTDFIGDNVTLEDVLNAVIGTIALSLIPALTTLVTTLAPVVAVFTSIIALSASLDEGQKKWALAIGAVVLALPPLVTAVSSVVTVITTLVGWISGASGVVASLGALLNPVGLAVAAVAGLGIAWATDFGGIRTKTTEVVGQVGQTISSWSSDTVEKFQTTQAQIGTTLAGWSTSLESTLSNLSSQTGSTLNTWATEVVQRFNTLRNDSQNAFSGMSSSIQSSATNLAAQALISLRRLETEGVPIFSKFRENAVNKIGEMVGDVPRRLRELVDAGLRVFDVGKWIQAGADVIGGVLRGLQNAATAPLRWIENFASGLVGVFKSILKIASPSQVFEETGVNIMEGLQGGLEDRSGAVLGFMNQFSRDLVETSAAAQRLADAEFKKLTDSATAAYNGFVVTANNIATVSQEIDAAAIALQNQQATAYAHQQAGGDPTYGGVITPGMTLQQQIAALQQQQQQQQQMSNAFGTGRIADLIGQITSIVTTSFRQVGSTGIQSLGIDLAQFANAGQIQNAIAQLSLLAGTIQQNAQNAPAAQDRARLESLYSDVSRRILPLLQTELQRQSAAQAEAAQLAAAEMASRREAAQPFFTQLAESVSRFAGETWSGVNRIVFSQSGWANLAQEAKDAVLGIIQQGQQGLVQQEGVADAVNTLRNVTVDTDQTRVAEALGRLVEFRSWFNSLIDASGFGEQIRAANNGSAGFTAARSQGSSIINNFNLAYSTLQSSQSVMSDVEYLNALYGAI